MAKVRMECVGGEQDGLSRELSPSQIPQIFYAVPSSDQEKITNTKDNEAKRVLRDKLGVLAYKYDPLKSNPEVFRMVRTPVLDKVPTDL